MLGNSTMYHSSPGFCCNQVFVVSASSAMDFVKKLRTGSKTRMSAVTKVIKVSDFTCFLMEKVSHRYSGVRCECDILRSRIQCRLKTNIYSWVQIKPALEWPPGDRFGHPFHICHFTCKDGRRVYVCIGGLSLYNKVLSHSYQVVKVDLGRTAAQAIARLGKDQCYLLNCVG